MSRKPILLEFTINGIKEYESSECSFSFMNSQKVYDDVDSDSAVARIGKDINVYDSKIIAICGINASGKTTLLSIIGFIISIYFCNKSIESFTALLGRFYGSKAIEINVLFASGDRIFHIASEIAKDDGTFLFTEEELYELKPIKAISRKTIEDRSRYILRQKRSALAEEARLFLEDGKTIASMILDKSDKSIYFPPAAADDIDISTFQAVPPELISYLDRSIYSIELNDSKTLYRIRMKNSEDTEVSFKELMEMLSSGTKRGIVFFTHMFSVLRYGGYFLVDEIEDNYNKTIVMNIIEFFMRKSTNPNDAHLIFTTHYQELIDILDRNDSISIAIRTDDEKLAVRNLSQYLKRNDVKRSEILSSDYYDLGTAIDYQSYENLRKSIEMTVKQEKE